MKLLPQISPRAANAKLASSHAFIDDRSMSFMGNRE
jgi:hypothetical protein